ncbi:MAG: BamA/TamA family outer membrane protein [Gemmatimonadetes bacterium]|nr:BamA/TamA family outer membrane protein [Gemmatimonadota bacterium]
MKFSCLLVAPIIATERTGLWRRTFGWNVGPLTCLDTVELRPDATRIHDLYEERGYFGTAVRATVERHGERRARVKFIIEEAAAVLVESVIVTGVPPEAVNLRELERRLLHAPFDSLVRKTVRDSVQGLVKGRGYANALEPIDSSRFDPVTRRGTVRLVYRPGPLVRVGPIVVRFTDTTRAPALDADAVKSLLRFHTGQRLEPRRIAGSQRDLYASELYRSVRIDYVPVDSTVDSVFVQLTEGDRRRARIGAGWGTLDCFRAQSRYVEENFLSSGHRVELNGRLSKIGMAAPLGGFSGLCAPTTRDDPFSQDLNYYAGATLNLRGLLGANLRPALTLFTERRSEPYAYEQKTDIGAVASLARELSPRLMATTQYQYVDATTVADRAVSCTTFGFCRLEDLTSFLLPSPIHSVSLSFARDPLLPTSDPDHGVRWQLDLKYGHTAISRTTPLDFGRVQGEVATYRQLSEWLVLASRVQAGFVFAPKDRSVLLPPAERFYSGGQNSVRGFGQNLLGPGSYIVDTLVTKTLPDGTVVGEVPATAGYKRIAPSGGNAMWVANVELRTRRGWPADLLRWAFFVDAGQVWNSNDVFSVLNAQPKVTPGIGVRLMTPLGPFRMDIGYNPYPLEAGPAFYVVNGDLAKGTLGTVTCVSPGTHDPMPGSGRPAAASCPATFTPTGRGGLLPRLAFQFSIGNAF